MKKLFFLSVLLVHGLMSQAAVVDTVSVYSAAMKRSIKTVVIRPEGVGASEKLPVVYLLHGAFGDYANWLRRVPHIKDLAEQYKVMIVCPDGGYTSWYFDSPVDPSYQFETFVAKEVPAYVDAHYATIADRRGRVITGLSMGGHGGIFLSFRHADVFSGGGSMSGALHVSVITQRYDVEKRLGDTITNQKYWRDWSALRVVENYPKDSLSIIIDSGTEDLGIIGMNRAMHDKLLNLKIPHEYTERPGQHNWVYWSNAIDYQLLFFRKHFNKLLGIRPL
ncbi:alpha/beta hydrolase [Sediminibacterium soli]|uniref:alpha/beta hydrolase n=1 Tax=Sediminibacterium soli TaxID=2698829 RepID=UPI00137A6887|nr:alpha/beta hydrolase family protein [Sediminibacterium soli]NCI46925.1 esterase family protein [Sediminibacterium soli]